MNTMKNENNMEPQKEIYAGQQAAADPGAEATGQPGKEEEKRDDTKDEGEVLSVVNRENPAEGVENERSGDGEKAAEAVPSSSAETEAVENPRERAQEKLRAELASAKDKSFAEPVIQYLIRRCGEDDGLAADVIQGNKTWEKCFDYIYSEARKRATGSRCAVRDDTVYEWAEDYYHAEERAKSISKAEPAKQKKKPTATARKPVPKRAEKPAKPKTDKATDPADKAPKPQKKNQKNKDIDGQMDIFSMLGI